MSGLYQHLFPSLKSTYIWVSIMSQRHMLNLPLLKVEKLEAKRQKSYVIE